MTTLTLPAPAKLNRLLHITGRREDGYHTLQTLFQIVDLCDQLSLTDREDGMIQLVNRVPGVADDDNLIVRAARLLQQASGTRQGATLALDKSLPMGGGLGGGSFPMRPRTLECRSQRALGSSRFLPGRNLARTWGFRWAADLRRLFVHGHSRPGREGVGEQLTNRRQLYRHPWFVHPSTPASARLRPLVRAVSRTPAIRHA